MNLDSNAILTLCSHICVGEGVRPLEPKEYSELAKKLGNIGKSPKDLFDFTVQDFEQLLDMTLDDFDRVKRIKELTKMPIVMHGGSGVSEEDYRKVIECGVRKINYYTYMAKAGGEAVAKLSDDIFFHDAVVAVENAMKRNAKQAIAIFGGMSHWWGKNESVYF